MFRWRSRQQWSSRDWIGPSRLFFVRLVSHVGHPGGRYVRILVEWVVVNEKITVADLHIGT
jgi:hypothetical protein